MVHLKDPEEPDLDPIVTTKYFPSEKVDKG